jgi:hypothetical protein
MELFDRRKIGGRGRENGGERRRYAEKGRRRREKKKEEKGHQDLQLTGQAVFFQFKLF